MDTGRRDAILMLLLVFVAFLACLTLMVVRLSDDGMTEEQPAADTVEARESLLPTASNPGGIAESIAESSDSAELLASTESSASSANNTFIKRDCPLTLPESCSSLNYQEGVFSETWRSYSNEDCRDMAARLLTDLQQAKAQLLHAGYLDISAEAWGCAVKTAKDEALTITLIPQEIGSIQADDTKLCVSVVRIKAPDFGL